MGQKFSRIILPSIMTPQRPPFASPQDIAFLSKVAAYWKSKELQPDSATQFGRFVVKETLGQGGFGIVYRAFDPLLGRDVAIKVPGLQSLSDESRLKRFLAEARHLGSLSHPNIAEIYEANEVDGLCYIAMKYYPAGTLADWLAGQKQPIPSQLVAKIFEGIVKGVAAAHTVGIVHRDLKPSNILIASNGAELVPCVADFGLAKNNATDDQSYSLARFAQAGTVEYMAPEKFTDQPEATQAGDVFALGVILFELLVGSKPVLYNSAAKPTAQVLVGEVAVEQQLQTAIQNLRSIRPDASSALTRIVTKCLKFHTGERYADARELLVELQTVSTTNPIRALRFQLIFKKVTVAVATIAALAVAIWQGSQDRPAHIEPPPSSLVEAPSNPAESQYSYALEIQAAFARSKSDSASARRKAVDRALSFLPQKGAPFEAAYLDNLGDSSREFTLSFGKSHWIPKTTISQDGKWLAVNGTMRDVLLFDLDHPRTVRRYQGFQDGAFRMAISPSNRYVVGIDSIYKQPHRSAPQILLWDFETAQLLLDLNVHLGLINIITCEFISDNQLLLSGMFRNGEHVKIFSIDDKVVEQSNPIAPLSSGHALVDENLRFQISEAVRTTAEPPKITFLDKLNQFKTTYELKHDAVALAVSPTGLIAIVDSPNASSNLEHSTLPERQIIVWNPQTQAELFRESQINSSQISAIAFSPDEESIFFIDMEGNVRQRSLKQSSLESSSDGLAPKETWTVHFHPTEPQLLYSGDGGWVGLRDLTFLPEAQRASLQTPNRKWSLHGEMLVTQCAWRPGYKDQFATASFDGTVCLWRLTQEKPEKLVEFTHPDRVRCIAFTADGAQLASGCEDQLIRIFDIESQKLNATLAGHTAKVRSLAYSIDAHKLFSSANDSSIISWNLSRGEPDDIVQLSTNSLCSAVSPDGKWLVNGTESGMLGIRSLADENEAKNLAVSKQWLRCVAISRDSQTLATGTQDGEIALWHLPTGIKLADFAKQSSPIMSLSFAADNRTLTAGLYSGQLVSWQASRGLRPPTAGR